MASRYAHDMFIAFVSHVLKRHSEYNNVVREFAARVTPHFIVDGDIDEISRLARMFNDDEVRSYLLDKEWTMFIFGRNKDDETWIWSNTMYDYRFHHLDEIQAYIRPRMIECLRPDGKTSLRFKFEFFQLCLELVGVPPWRCECGCNQIYPVLWHENGDEMKAIVRGMGIPVGEEDGVEPIDVDDDEDTIDDM